jgi:AcrR family transcriptional regulator
MALRVKPEKKEEKERVAFALLRATLGLAAAHGFSSLGLREVARAAEIAPTSFYRHFADMEALGIVLIEDLVGQFVTGWVEAPKATQPAAKGAALRIATRALESVAADPDLVRFMLAERVGAVASFRAALKKKLVIVSDGLRNAIAQDLGANSTSVPSSLVEAAEALVLEACAEALEEGPERVPALSDRIAQQLRMLTTGAKAAGGAV